VRVVDYFTVIFWGGVDVVVVVIQPRLGQPPRLIARQHAERHAGFQPHRADARYHLDDRVHVAVLGLAPRGTHAETLAARRFRLGGAGEDGIHVHQLFGL
jgi:hypothetical protein